MTNYILRNAIDNIIETEGDASIAVIGSLSKIFAKQDVISECYHKTDTTQTFAIYQESTMMSPLIPEINNYNESIDMSYIKRDYSNEPDMFDIFLEAASADANAPDKSNAQEDVKKGVNRFIPPTLPKTTQSIYNYGNGLFSKTPAVDRTIAKSLSLAYNASYYAKNKQDKIVPDIKEFSNIKISHGYHAKTFLAAHALNEIKKNKTTTFKATVINDTTGRTDNSSTSEPCVITYFDIFLPKKVFNVDAYNLFTLYDELCEYKSIQRQATSNRKKLDKSSPEYKKETDTMLEMSEKTNKNSKLFKNIRGILWDKFNIRTDEEHGFENEIRSLAKDLCLTDSNDPDNKIRYQISFHFPTISDKTNKDYASFDYMNKAGIADKNYQNNYHINDVSRSSHNSVIRLRDQYRLNK